MTTAQRLDQLDRAVAIMADRMEWFCLELLDGLSNEKFEELQRREILSLLEATASEDEAEARAARITLERFGLVCPDVIPNDLSDVGI